MFSLRSLALLTALTATAYGTGTFKVVNNCPYDLSALGDTGTTTLKAGGGSTPAREHSTDQTANRYSLQRDGVDGMLETITRITPNPDQIFYEVWFYQSNPIDGHITLSTDDGACPPITSDQNLGIDSPDTSRRCSSNASVTLTLCD